MQGALGLEEEELQQAQLRSLLLVFEIRTPATQHAHERVDLIARLDQARVREQAHEVLRLGSIRRIAQLCSRCQHLHGVAQSSLNVRTAAGTRAFYSLDSKVPGKAWAQLSERQHACIGRDRLQNAKELRTSSMAKTGCMLSTEMNVLQQGQRCRLSRWREMQS